MKLKAPGAWIARTETLTDDALPNTAASAELCNFLEEANRDIEEEREARQEGVRIKSALDTSNFEHFDDPDEGVAQTAAKLPKGLFDEFTKLCAAF